MSITVQKGFFKDQYLSNVREKLRFLYQRDPSIAHSEKKTILAYWKAYDGLASHVVNDIHAFEEWYLTATSNESITRCLRALREDGTLKASQDEINRRQQQAREYRRFWSEGKTHDPKGGSDV